MNTPRILIVATSADKMNNGEATGIWLEELTTPFYAFQDANAHVTLASIRGGQIPIDQRSVAPKGENDASVERYLTDSTVIDRVANSVPLASVLSDLNQFDALFLPGGHGTMFDYPKDPNLKKAIEAFDKAGKIISAVCHGPAGLIGAQKQDGTPFITGRTVAGFTDSEEHAVGLQDAVPFLLETAFRELGANVSLAADFQSHAVRDGNLITGQNPASAQATATLVINALTAPAIV